MQSSFSDLEYAAKKKLTRRDHFLAGIHAATPWAALEAEIEPFHPKGEGRGVRRLACRGCCACTWRSSASACPTTGWQRVFPPPLYATYPNDICGVGTFTIRYSDAAKVDDSWVYVKSVRRVRRLSGNAWMDPIGGTVSLNDDIDGWDSPPSWYRQMNLVGKRWILAVAHVSPVHARPLLDTPGNTVIGVSVIQSLYLNRDRRPFGQYNQGVLGVHFDGTI